MNLQNLRGLIKLKCCIVCLTGGATAILVIIGTNLIHTGISGTIAMVYSIALLQLICIMAHEKISNRQPRTARLAEENAGAGSG